MTERARLLGEKLLALARQGVGGEKENAENALMRHLQKYGLTLSDFEQQIETVKIDLPWLKDDKNGRNAFYVQIVASVIGRDRASVYEIWENRQGKQILRIKGTLEEKIEIEAKVEFYWQDYQAQMKIFYEAYVQKNHLYALPNSDTKLIGEEPRLTPEERERLRKMNQMMEGIDRKTVYKQLPK